MRAAELRLATLVAACMAALAAYRFARAQESAPGMSISGLAFPPTLRMGGTSMRLVGGGTRFKFNVVKVYAAGLYLQDTASSGALKQWRGTTAPALRKKTDFFRALVAGRFGKALVLIFHRSVSAATLVEALRDSLSTRLTRTSLATFREHLLKVLGAEVPKGSQLYFSCRSDTMQFALDSPSTASTLHDKSLCSALFDVYLGNSPISTSIKEGVADGFATRMGGA